MKQYTTPEQTSKLIELGFEKPKSIEAYRDGHCVPFVEQQWTYSIGELIEMLPKYVNIWDDMDIERMERIWHVGYISSANNIERAELIDALYDMLVKLKEEGVI